MGNTKVLIRSIFRVRFYFYYHVCVFLFVTLHIPVHVQTTKTTNSPVIKTTAGRLICSPSDVGIFSRPECQDLLSRIYGRPERNEGRTLAEIEAILAKLPKYEDYLRGDVLGSIYRHDKKTRQEDVARENERQKQREKEHSEYENNKGRNQNLFSDMARENRENERQRQREKEQREYEIDKERNQNLFSNHNPVKEKDKSWKSVTFGIIILIGIVPTIVAIIICLERQGCSRGRTSYPWSIPPLNQQDSSGLIPIDRTTGLIGYEQRRESSDWVPTSVTAVDAEPPPYSQCVPTAPPHEEELESHGPSVSSRRIPGPTF